MFQQKWALIELDAAAVSVYIISDICSVFEHMSLNFGVRTKELLLENGSPRFTDDQQRSRSQIHRFSFHPPCSFNRLNPIDSLLLEISMIENFLNNLLLTIRRNPIGLIWQCFVAFSVGWTVTGASYHFADGRAPFLKEITWLYFIGTLSMIWAFISNWQVTKVLIRLMQSNVTVEVTFGDIFNNDGIKAIPVNEYFDSEFGLPVSPKSLQGIFITNASVGPSKHSINR